MYYTDDNRGIIQNRERRRQIIDFSKVRIKNITPTDIDGFVEYENKGFIFTEIKYGEAKPSRGQKLAYERLVDDLNKPAICIYANHYISNPEKDIDGEADCKVQYIYFNGHYYKAMADVTVLDVVQEFTDWLDGKIDTFFKSEVMSNKSYFN